ncbi:dihydroorotate dehydrogenase 2 [Neokomagataea thailandica NBRC 106555]|nr:dihydroorotate dehydrogenase 2 [Neokomagataea thailandica NBRC 106555]
MGFGHVEAGTVTPRPQPGNPQPRLFRLPEDGAIINRMGFNGCGIDRFCRNLARLHRPQPNGRLRGPLAPLGANIGINKTGADPLKDYPELVARVRPYADYITINLSSPNTPGLRDLQSAEFLTQLLDAVNKRNAERPPLLIKLAPDMANAAYAPILEAAINGGAQGLILTNTTIARPDSLTSPHAHESGGLSGRPLTSRAREVLQHVSAINKGRLTLISAGGIETGRDILDRIRLGASMVQLYTSFILEGASILPRLKAELLQSMRDDGFNSLEEAFGVDRP